MKNRIKMLGLIAVVAMVGFSMAACSNGVDDVNIVLKPVPQVTSVTVTTNTGAPDRRIIRWTATTSIADHDIVFRQVGGVVVRDFPGFVTPVTNTVTLEDDGNWVPNNPNIDRFVAEIDLNALPNGSTGTNSFNIGIKSYPDLFHLVRDTYSITWLPGTFERP